MGITRYKQVITGSVTADQGAPNVVANAWPVKITDGVDTAAVMPASTAPAATDPALVVAISPNTPVTLAGTKSNNTVPPGANNIGVLPAVATAAAPVYIEGNQVAASTLLTGATRIDNTSWLGSTAPTVGQKAMAASVPVVLASNQTPVSVTFTPPTPAVTGLNSGLISLGGGTAGSLNAIRATPYTEQSVNAQRSVKSSSASDTALGVGARTIRINYLTSAGIALSEIVTLNGTTAVNTVAVNICYIEKITVVTAGTSLRNVGTITLFVGLGGLGGTIGTIGVGNLITAQGDNETLWAHHYVPTGVVAQLATYIISADSAGSATNATFWLSSVTLPASDNAEVVISDIMLAIGPFARTSTIPINITGFKRITAYGVPGNNNTKLNSSFDFSEL